MKHAEIMVGNVKKSEKSIIAGAILTLIIGLMLAIYPADSLSILTKIISIGLMIIGVYELVEFFRETKEERIGNASFALGVIIFAIGLYVFLHDASLKEFVTIMIGILVCIKSIYKIQLAFSLKDYSSNWKYALVSGIIILSLGIVMIFYPGESADTVVRLVGVGLMVSSIYEIVESIMFMKSLDKVTDAVFVEKKEK